ncbi:hypothetical protein K438DRAFT_1776209 [Mycena galopus ATCC 62051]|nr:hypothetical protein K438DRAFT_1776209 [Mycena galopus ATCC 62051]
MPSVWALNFHTLLNTHGADPKSHFQERCVLEARLNQPNEVEIGMQEARKKHGKVKSNRKRAGVLGKIETGATRLDPQCKKHRCVESGNGKYNGGWGSISTSACLNEKCCASLQVAWLPVKYAQEERKLIVILSNRQWMRTASNIEFRCTKHWLRMVRPPTI